MGNQTTEERLHGAERARQFADALFEIQRHLGTASDSEEVVGLVLGLGCEALDANFGSIDRRELGGWVTSHIWGAAPARAGVFHNDDASPILADVKQTGQPVVAADAGDGAQMSLPLTSRGRVVGALSFSVEGPVSPEELQFGSRLAMLLSMAQENRAQLQRHRRVAEAFQRALIDAPLALNGVEIGHLYAPATDAEFAGGDFYDVFPLEDGRIAFSIGDVSGRGLAAATTTALVRDCIRVTTLDGLSPAEVLGKTNRILLAFGSPEMFATVFFGILDPRTGVVTYAAGGCPPPLLLNPERRVRSAEGVDPLLGVLPEVHFETRQLVLASCERLVCFTNGLPEARRGDEWLQTAGIERILLGSDRDGARGLAQDLYEGALEFSGGALNDDVAVLILSICDRA